MNGTLSHVRDISGLNEILAEIQPRLETRAAPIWPTVFVIGAPRSGTTLTGQLLAHCGLLGYISNFVAQFWSAPAVGASIDAVTNLCGSLVDSSFRSSNGRTEGWAEPHEFGYFWDRWFDFGEDTHFLSDTARKRIDWVRLSRELASIEAAYEKPMCYKNNTWCTFQADLLARAFPSALFVVCHREPLYVAQSLLEARYKRFGDANSWWSMRPRRYRELLDLPYWDQVVLQALEVEKDMMDVLRRIPAERQIHAQYETYCSSPLKLVQDVIGYLRGHGVEAERTADCPSLVHTNQQRLANDDWTKIKESLERYS